MRTRHRRPLSFLILLVATALVASDAPDPVLRGFTPARSRAQRALEEKFLAVPDPAQAEAHHKTLTAEPHVAGSPADRRTAEYVLEQFRSYGLEAEIEEFYVLLSEPREIKLELLEPVRWSGPRPEYVQADPASDDRRTLMGFNGYSASGDATAEVVYAHHGLPAD